MRKKFIEAFVLLLLASCSASTSVSPLIGTWTGGTTITYNADATFVEVATDSSLAVTQTVKGTYSTAGSTLTTITTEATPTVAGLPKTLTSSFVIKGDSLTTTDADGTVRKYIRRN